jgi:hypothetical protein
LINVSAIPIDVKLVDRTDNSPRFFTKPISEGGLGLTASEIYDVSDGDRYDYRIYEEKSDASILGKYQRRIDMEDLRLLDERLIYVGSLFGSGRVRVTKKESIQNFLDLWATMVFNNPFLDAISSQVSHMLGGRDEYVGLHLRVGDGAFAVRLASQPGPRANASD